MSNYYVVRIYTKGYSVESVHQSFDEAAASVVKGRVSSSVVLRDGRTGKRYSVAELRQQKAA